MRNRNAARALVGDVAIPIHGGVPMAFELMPLPYPQDALAPVISANTLGYHPVSYTHLTLPTTERV